MRIKLLLLFLIVCCSSLMLIGGIGGNITDGMSKRNITAGVNEALPGHDKHSELFGGEIRFVSFASGVDTNGGFSPTDAYKTIKSAVAASANGDRIVVMAGLYTCVGLDINKDALELNFEIGAALAPATGVGMKVSSDYVKITGALDIAGNTGEFTVWVTGDSCRFEYIRAIGGLTCFEITGDANQFIYCKGFSPEATGSCFYSHGGNDYNRFWDCSAGGVTTSYGFRFDDSDLGLLDNCSSIDNQTAGYSFTGGSSDCVIKNCSTGGGDGRWVGVDTNIWSNFTYEHLLHKDTILDTSGAATYEDNLFIITGIVQVNFIYGYTTEAVSGCNVTATYLDLFPTAGAAIEITDNVGTAITGLPIGSLLSKNALATTAINVQSSALGFVDEVLTNFRNSQKPFVVGKKSGAVTQIRYVYTSAVTIATGKIHWHIDWTPLSEDGFVSVAP